MIIKSDFSPQVNSNVGYPIWEANQDGQNPQTIVEKSLDKGVKKVI